MSATNLTIKKKFNLSKRQLFDAWSNPSIMQRWLFGDRLRDNCCTVINSFVTKGKYKITMHFDETGDSNMYGEYLEIIRYNSIIFSWSNSLVTNSIVKLSFKSLSENTSELKLEHSLFPDEESQLMHNQGWVICLENLAIALEKSK